MRKTMIICLIALGFVLSSCSGEKAKDKSEEVPQFLDVQLAVTPDSPQPGEEVNFEATVTYGDKKVENPEDIQFEIWRSQDDSHEKLTPKNNGKGKFTLTKTFKEEGTYYVISHVTAMDMHNMPKKEFVIGKPSEPEKSNKNMDSNSNKMEHDSTKHEH
ncbi:FixH family protein [Bacillus massilinigeriensis]|uniref:FixH family protein n=1 Tax=Bacillus mediterraneensis TaxID=1805474 RepID=UPI0008F82B5E|nr:FixH family protein [Bacillus mediterraneensis]